MESQELRIFVEVAAAGSITKAADQLGYVQSNITAHIKHLEEELQVTLFLRHAKGVSLTKEGEQLLYQAQQILSLLDQFTNSFQKQKKQLRIGATQTIAGYVLPQALLRLQKEHPNCQVSCITADQEQMEKELQQGELDCVFTNQERPLSSARCVLQCKERLLLVAPAAYQTMDSLEALPLIVNQLTTCPYRHQLLEWWYTQYFKAPKLIEVDTVETMLHLVIQGGGWTLLPDHVMRDTNAYSLFYLEELQTTMIRMWVGKGKHSSACQALCDYMNDLI